MHSSAKDNHGIDDWGRNAEFHTQVMVYLASNRNIFRDISVINAVGADISFIAGLIQRKYNIVFSVLICSHVLLCQDAPPGEKGFVTICRNLNANCSGNRSFLFVELILDAADGGTESM